LWFISPFAAMLVWEANFSVALVYQPHRLPEIPNAMPAVAAINLVYFFAGMAILLVRYRALRDVTERRRVRLLVGGTVLGGLSAAPAVAALWLDTRGGVALMYEPPSSLRLAYAAILIMPLTFWWAIVHHRLYGIDFVVRRGLQYVFARGTLLVVTPLVLIALAVEASLHNREPLPQLLAHHAYLYLAVAGALVYFHVRRRDWLDKLDHRFFRERYDACQLLRAVAATIRTTRNLESAARFVVDRVDEALHLRSLGLYCRRAGEQHFHPLASKPEPAQPLPAYVSLMAFVRSLQKPLEIDLKRGSWLRDHLPDAEVDMLLRTGINLIVPVHVGAGTSEVLLALGSKMSEEPFSREDISLLQGIAESLGELVEPRAIAPEGEASAGGEGDDRLDDYPAGVADAVVAGLEVDWDLAESNAPESQRAFVRELKMLARMMDVHTATAVVDEVAATTSGDRDVASRTSLTRWGSFELLERIGSGSFGSVYHSLDNLDRHVAVKVLHHDRTDRSRLLAEAKRLAKVEHPNVVRVYGADEHHAGFWMELISGETLAQLLARNGPFAHQEAAAIGETVCSALAAVHAVQLIHQDVQARNVMREQVRDAPPGDRRSEEPPRFRRVRYVLMDFGASVTAGDPRPPRSGTLLYMAPELFEGAPASFASDIYSLGVLMFHLVTCAFPVTGDTFEEIRTAHHRSQRRWLRDLCPTLPAGFLSAVDRAIAHDPDDRFRSAGEFEHALRSRRHLDGRTLVG
jgi:hypothetical protein